MQYYYHKWHYSATQANLKNNDETEDLARHEEPKVQTCNLLTHPENILIARIVIIVALRTFYY